MKSYAKYKDSGVEWIGEIPTHWDLIRLRRIAAIENGATPKSDVEKYWDGEIAWVTPDDIGKNESKYITGSARKITDEGFESCGTTLAPINSIVLSTRAPIGHLGIAKVELCTNQGCRAIIFHRADPNFMYYYLCMGKAELQSLGQGSTFTELSSSKLRDFKIAFPPPPEQTIIANYLNERTSRIDCLIEKKQKLIELLKEQRTAIINQAVTKGINPKAKMKDSGIEWLGEIPEHWEVKKLKYIAINISKGTTPSTIGKELVLSGSIRYIKAENIVNNSISSEPEYFIDEETNEILSRSQLKENDILFVIAGATLGKVAILRKEFLPANTNQAVSFIRFHWTENHRFVWYWLQSSRIIELTWLDAVQSAQPNLSMESLGNFHVPYPPLSERNEIVRRIDETLSSTNRMIQRIEQEIVLLQEYRTALISEVVTGKVDVREWARYEQSDEQELMRAAEKTSNYKSR